MAPQNGWLKLNCDASVAQLGANAVVGGVLRDASRDFILAFSSPLGSCNTLVAELHAILLGLKLLAVRGDTRVATESDSLLAIRLIKGGCSSLHPNHSIIHDGGMLHISCSSGSQPSD